MQYSDPFAWGPSQVSAFAIHRWRPKYGPDPAANLDPLGDAAGRVPANGLPYMAYAGVASFEVVITIGRFVT